MTVANVVCPRCHAGLKTALWPAAGNTVRCPSCGTTFQAPAADQRVIYVQATAAQPPAAMPVAIGVAGNADRPGAINLGRLGLVAVGGVLYLAVGVALACYCLAPGNKDRASAGHPESEPATGMAAPGGQKPVTQMITLPKEEQVAVNQAIDRGVRFLKTSQNPQGTWGSPPVGYAALPGLTLLECGVPANDPNVQKAATFVRQNTATLDHTYSLALAILFLDRLGDPQDSELIATLAVRLVAGQTATGGWTYNCPVLTSEDHKQLYQVLEVTRPRSAQELYATYKLGPQDGLLMSEPGALDRGQATGNRLAGGSSGGQHAPGVSELGRLPAVAALPANWKNLPVFRPPATNDDLRRGDVSDNSNTQFALLGLWVARRRHLPVERSLALIVTRFRGSQNGDGSWSYKPNQMVSQFPTMTCAGLLGLAVGQGLASDADVKEDRPGQDPAVDKAMRLLGQRIGQPVQRPIGRSANRPDPRTPLIDMYFLWSLERVSVLYNLPSIGGKSWYLWGAEKLLVNQNADNGSWSGGGYPSATPTIDTCFALLFLTQANLAQDLTNKLQLLHAPG